MVRLRLGSLGISTDARTITDVTLVDEYTRLAAAFGWTLDDLHACRNPRPGSDHRFNLGYGRAYTAHPPLVAEDRDDAFRRTRDARSGPHCAYLPTSRSGRR